VAAWQRSVKDEETESPVIKDLIRRICEFLMINPLVRKYKRISPLGKGRDRHVGSSGSSENLTVLLLESDSTGAKTTGLLGLDGFFFPNVIKAE